MNPVKGLLRCQADRYMTEAVIPLQMSEVVVKGSGVLLKEPIPLCPVNIRRGLGIDDLFYVLDRSRSIPVGAKSEDITGFLGISSPGQGHSERGHLPGEVRE